jgi:hypothetical protein
MNLFNILSLILEAGVALTGLWIGQVKKSSTAG